MTILQYKKQEINEGYALGIELDYLKTGMS